VLKLLNFEVWDPYQNIEPYRSYQSNLGGLKAIEQMGYSI